MALACRLANARGQSRARRSSVSVNKETNFSGGNYETWKAEIAADAGGRGRARGGGIGVSRPGAPLVAGPCRARRRNAICYGPAPNSVAYHIVIHLVDSAAPIPADGLGVAPDRIDTIRTALTGFAAAGAIHDIHNVRVRDTDAGEIVNFHCRAAPSMSVIKVHENVDAIERALRRAFPTVKRVISHAEPPKA